VYKERAFVKSKIRNATSKNTHHDKDTDSADKKRQKSPVRRSLRARRVEGAIASLLKKKNKKKERRKNIEVKIIRGGRERASSPFRFAPRWSHGGVVEAGCTIYRGECGFRAFRDISCYLHV